jgi:hypothetical protein
LSFTAKDGTPVHWNAINRQIIDIDASNHTCLPTSDIKNGSWLKPIKYDEGCFDLIYYRCNGSVDFFQFTAAERGHDYELKFIAAVLPALTNSRVGQNSVNLFVVIPEENEFSFGVTPGNLKNSSLVSTFDGRWSNDTTVISGPLQVLHYRV